MIDWAMISEIMNILLWIFAGLAIMVIIVFLIVIIKYGKDRDNKD